MIQLRGGFTTKDARLDRLPEMDPKSRNFPIRGLVAAAQPRSMSWAVPVVLDQGKEGACVGFSWSHELAGRPVQVKNITNDTALALYRQAQTLDDYPGEDYSGSSVLGGAKAVEQQGHLKEYRWAFGIADLILALGYHGPAVLGIDWYGSMYEPIYRDGDFWVTVEGDKVGGHAILANGVSIRRQAIKLHNSWGYDWGDRGESWVSFDDIDHLLKGGGEACIPVQRT
jgi:hypothetical protein